MPLKRYEIRNEYSLADPDLYKVADKDDPEALLEGVAMAGLVGLLRQLGDLAEFAAEIFHDLHEEVMATAGRGHGLIARVQQLEAEFPNIERKLLSQTSHTAFLYNSGVDWHPNLRMDQNTVTQGDLPRFVMDSYEECRGPPRLFLLDKFDVAGAGACLKRFTDPSFFRTESASSSGRNSEGQREKKTRRVKKRGPRWRNGDTPECFPSSHAKLHQLFLEERIESGGNDPDRRVKLKKRQFTGSLFDQEKTKSYMEIYLDSCTPEQKIVHEVVDPLPLTWTSYNASKPGLDIVEIGTDSPLNESVKTCSSPVIREIAVEKSKDDFKDGKSNGISNTEAVEGPVFTYKIQDGNISPTITDGESKSEDSSGDACSSDDVASEIDNYVDALATIESEVETDSECKQYPRNSILKRVVVDFDGRLSKLELQDRFLDSQSAENSAASEDGNNYFGQGNRSSCSSVNALAETASDLDAGVVAVPFDPASSSDHEGMLSDRRSLSGEILGTESEEHAVATYPDGKADGIGRAAQAFHLTTELQTKVIPDKKDAHSTENSVPGPELDEVYSNSTLGVIVSGERDKCHADEDGTWSSSGTFLNTHESVDGGHCTIDQLVPDKAEQNSRAYFDSSLDPPNCSDGLTGVLKVESHKSESGTSSVEEHTKELVLADGDACSPVSSLLEHQAVELPEKMDPICEVQEGGHVSTKGNMQDPSSSSDSIESFGMRQQLSERIGDDHHTPSCDSATRLFSCFEGDPSIEEASDAAENGKRVSLAPINHAEILLPVSTTLDSSDPDYSSLVIPQETETAECGSREAHIASSGDQLHTEISPQHTDRDVKGDSLLMGNQSSVLDLVEAEGWCQKHPSEVTVADLIDSRQAEVAEQYSVDNTFIGLDSVTIGKDECDVAFRVSERDAVNHEFTASYLDQTQEVVMNAHLDAPKTHTVQVEARDHAPNNQREDENIYPSDVSLSEVPSKHGNDSKSVSAAENGAGENVVPSKHAGVEYVEHTETLVCIGKHPDVIDNLSHNAIPWFSHNIHVEKKQEPHSMSEEYHENEDALEGRTAEVTGDKNMTSVQDALVNSTSNLCDVSFDDSPSMSLHGSLPDSAKNSVNLVANCPLPSENSSQDTVSASEEGNLSEPVLSLDTSEEPQINFEAPPLPPLPPMQWRSSRFQTASPAPERQLMRHTASQVYAQPISLPPMQHELRQNPLMSLPTVYHTSAPTQPISLPTVDYSISPVESIALPAQHHAQTPVLPTVNNEVETIAHMRNGGMPGYLDGYLIVQGGFTLPMLAAVSDGSTQNHTSVSARQPNLLFSAPSTSGYVSPQGGFTLPLMTTVPESIGEIRRHNAPSSSTPSTSTSPWSGAHVSSELNQLNVNAHESESFIEGHASEQNHKEVMAKETADICALDEVIGEMSQAREQETENSNAQFLPPSTVHHPSAGFVASQGERTWFNTSDGLPYLAGDDVNGAVQKKPPRPRNPLIDEVVAIDKSKLRKVERVRPSLVSKPEEGESLLEQMQLRKVERVKLPVDTNVANGGSMMEQFQLRKVGERVKPPTESKSEEREFIPEQLQLRKVAHKVKPEAEPRAEETESPRMQLRKVSERVKHEVEVKLEETDSPRMQLRKTHPPETPKPEERDSLFEQIRNKSFSLKPAVAARPNIQGPRTNLKVAAILEKASNIRQAMAGSDEDDDADSWSDCS